MTRHRYNPTPTSKSSTVHPVHSDHLVHLLTMLILAIGLVACGHGASKEEKETAETEVHTRDLPLDPVVQSSESVGSRVIEDETITSQDIIDASISAEDIATGAVTTDEILNETIHFDNLPVGSVKYRLSIGAVTSTGRDNALDPSPVERLSRTDIGGAFSNNDNEPDPNIVLDDSQQSTSTSQPVRENNFRSATTTPFSTFSIDVDAASYSNVRGFINRGAAPPPEMVRIEELVNYFTYDYPEPTDRHPFAFATEVAPCPWKPENRLVRVALQGRRVDVGAIPPSNLVFLIDVSGSMNSRLPLLKKSFGSLINRLRQDDRVAIVTYAGNSGVALESTDGSEKRKILEAVDRLKSGGSTAGAAGIQRAYDIAKSNFIEGGNNRIILATDGDFNVGVSDQEGLVKLIEEKREEGIFLSVLGFGHGNYQDAKMEQLADNGNGNYYYIDRIEEGERVFGEGLAGTLLTIAKDVKLQIRFNPEHVAAYRLIGYENRTMAAQDFANDRKDAGELGAGHSVTAFYEVIPVGTDPSVEIDTTASADYHLEDAPPNLFTPNDILLARLRYKAPEDTVSSLIEHLVRDEPKKIDEVDDDFRFAAAVAAWGMLLRGSSYAGSATSSQVITLAESGKGSDRDGFRAEFVGLVEKWRKEVEGIVGR